MGRRKKMPKEQRAAYAAKRAEKREFLLKKKQMMRAEKTQAREARKADKASR